MASENTVRGHLRSVFQKLGVRNRVQAVSVALRTGLIARR
ncbi:MAG: LuxR C-terminal-related transcriptional regulator [Dehalococcoidia bacterium]